MIRASLIRTKNCSTDDTGDFTIVEDQNLELINKHSEYVDDKGFIRNK